MTSISSQIVDFLSNYCLNERGLSKNTISTYSHGLTQLLLFIRDKKGIDLDKVSVQNINQKLVLDFLDYLEIDCQLSVSTRNLRLASIKSFFSYLNYRSSIYIPSSELIKHIKMKKKIHSRMEWLSPESINTILEKIGLENSRMKHYNITLFLIDTGVRVQELLDVKMSDIQFSSTSKVYIKGKGGKVRMIPLTTRLKNSLLKYISHYNISGDQYLFANKYNRQMTRSGITYIVKKYVSIASSENPEIQPKLVSCHTYRHSKAMQLLNAGVDLISIRDILGHENLSTTEIYLKEDEVKKQQAIELSVKDLDLPLERPKWKTEKSIIDILKQFH